MSDERDSGNSSVSPGGDPDATKPAGPRRESSQQVGPYRLLEKIGDGGMGEVWLAEQQEPVRRRVALKLIKRGMDTREVIARFEAERQALALMDHPNIARVYDAGETPGGRPFFAMEYVKGEPITSYCDRQRLEIRERLELFMLACEGVQHAHHKAVIHRDIKASNVLVTVVDGKPTVKIIDFGVAKAVEHRLTERTIHTELGMLVGTPEYMSPEQAEMGTTDIDTRTDVYSLGVLLYELLTGTLPFASSVLRSAGYGELCRRIREDEPARPSTRVATLAGEKTTESARKRRTEPRTLRRSLRGDLDWITMRALEKDRTRRYESPTALADDLRRHLCNEPVLAGPPSAAYRAGRFVRRHRMGFAVVSTAALIVVGLLVAVSIQARRIARERDRAEQASADLRTVVQFQAEMLSGVDPEGMGRRLITDLRERDARARGERGGAEAGFEAAGRLFERVNATDAALRVIDEEILRRAIDTVGERYRERPRIDAQLRSTIGWTYLTLGLYKEAADQLERSLELRRRYLGDEDPDTLTSMSNLAVVYQNQGRYEQAETLQLDALEKRQQVLGSEHPDTLASMHQLGTLYQNQGRYDRAEELLTEALDARRRSLGSEDQDTLDTMNSLALVYRAQGRYEQAEELYLETLEAKRRVLGDHHIETVTSLNNLALLYKTQRRYDEAEPLYLETVETYRRALGDHHPNTLMGLTNLAVLYKEQGRYDEAEAIYLDNIRVAREQLGNKHPFTLTAMNNLAVLYANQGRMAEAASLLEQTLDMTERALGRDHPDTLQTMHSLAYVHMRERRYLEAEQLFRETLAGQRRALGDDHPKTLKTKHNLATVYRDSGQYADAEALYAETVEQCRRVFGENHRATLLSTNDLARLLLTREPEEARNPRRALELALRVNERSESENPEWLATLSRAYCASGRQDKALETQKRAISLSEENSLERSKLREELALFQKSCP